MGPKPKRALSEHEKVKRRQTSREWRRRKAQEDPEWQKKEADRIAKLYVPKDKCSKEEWEAYKKQKREGMTRHRDRKKAAENHDKRRGRSAGTTPEVYELPPSKTRRPVAGADEACTSSKKLTVRMPAVYNKCRALKRQLDKSEKENTSLKRKMARLGTNMSKTRGTEMTPNTPTREARDLLIDINKTPTHSAIKKVTPYTATMKALRSTSLKTKRKLLSSTSPNKKSKGLAKSVGKVSLTPRRYVFHTKKYRPTKKLISESRKKLAIAYLKRADNSSQLPGKKHNVRGQVKYGLRDTMEHLYKKFRSEYFNIQMSRSSFFSARPNYIKLVQWTNRNQCLCQVCANICLLINATKDLPRSGNGVSAMNDEEIETDLDREIPAQVTVKQWRKVDVNFNGKLIKKTKKIDVTFSKAKFKAAFLEQVKNFREHCRRVETQYAQIRVLKQKMEPLREATVQCDYAENWKCRYQDEISAVFYDQNLITLHPMVVHYRDENGDLQHISFVGLTEEGKHCAPTTYSFIKVFLPELRSRLPDLKMLHYITDSPSSQYRNKTVAAIVSRHASNFGIDASWTYLESGHGKGPCDGVGGGVKKMADNAVKTGEIMSNIDEFCAVIKKKESKIIFIRVSSQDVQNSRDEIAAWNIISCDGIASAHALCPVRGSLTMKETSCFDDCCYTTGTFHAACQGWQETKIKVTSNRPTSSHNQPTQSTVDQPLPTSSVGTQKSGDVRNDTTEDLYQSDGEDDIPLAALSKNTSKQDSQNVIDEQDNRDDIYTMEYISAERYNKKQGCTEYLVKWAGWVKKNWEPEENILDTNVIQAFKMSKSSSQQ